MSRWTARLAALACALCATSACSKGGVQTASAATANPAGSSASVRANTDTAGLDCRKVLSPDDVAGLMKPPVTVSPFSGGVAWCHFTNDLSGDITMMVGSGRNMEYFWNDANVPSDSHKSVPLPGVGDKAVFEVDTHAGIPEIASRKGSVYCIVTYNGGTVDQFKAFKSVGGEELAKRLGALCNKSFVAFRA